jgi:hypothetical protein
MRASLLPALAREIKMHKRMRRDQWVIVTAAIAAQLLGAALYVVKNFVKASGGCSTPAVKNADEPMPMSATLSSVRFIQLQTMPMAVGMKPRSWSTIPTTRGCKWTKSPGFIFRPYTSMI